MYKSLVLIIVYYYTNKKFASLMSPTTSSVAQNLFYAQNQFIDITYIRSYLHFFKYYNVLKRKKSLEDITQDYIL